MPKKYIVTLTAEEQAALTALTRKGKVAVRRLARANILRMAHEKFTDQEIATALKVSIATIERTREKFVLGGLDFALPEDPRTGAPRKLDGKQDAFLVALACSTPPPGYSCWTMQLLADQLLERAVIEQPLSAETIRLALKKKILSPGCETSGAFQPSALNLSGTWRTCWTSMPSRIIPPFRWSVSMSVRINWSRRLASPCP
jgi:transposase